MNKTYLPTTENLDQKWYVIDAADQRLGRLATEVASILRGKNKATFTPHMDTGDFVVVVNAEKIDVTGKKREQKLYRRHSGRPGGMKEETFGKLQARLPERIIEQAIKGMLPKNALGRKLFTKLNNKRLSIIFIPQQPNKSSYFIRALCHIIKKIGNSKICHTDYVIPCCLGKIKIIIRIQIR